MTPSRPTSEPTTMRATLRERGYVDCRCGAQLKRTVGAWACTRKECEDLGRGGAAASSGTAGKDRSSVSLPASHPAPSKPAGREAEDKMAAALTAAGFYVQTYGEWLRTAAFTGSYSADCVREWPWGLLLVPSRRFRADFAFPRKGLLLEIEGGAHGIQKQRKHDVLRDQLAQQAGYRILRLLPDQIATGEALALVRAATKGGEHGKQG